MKNIEFPIYAVTALLVVVSLLTFIETDWATRLVLLTASLSPVPVIWMVYRVLKDGEPSEYTFEDRFYEDVER